MMMTILSVWLTLSQPGPQPDDPLDPPGKDALAPRHYDDEDDDDDIERMADAVTTGTSAG